MKVTLLNMQKQSNICQKHECSRRKKTININALIWVIGLLFNLTYVILSSQWKVRTW